MLASLILIPIIGSILLLPMNNTKMSEQNMKKIALITSLINFFISSLFFFYKIIYWTLENLLKKLIIKKILKYNIIYFFKKKLWNF